MSSVVNGLGDPDAFYDMMRNQLRDHTDIDDREDVQFTREVKDIHELLHDDLFITDSDLILLEPTHEVRTPCVLEIKRGNSDIQFTQAVYFHELKKRGIDTYMVRIQNDISELPREQHRLKIERCVNPNWNDYTEWYDGGDYVKTANGLHHDYHSYRSWEMDIRESPDRNIGSFQEYDYHPVFVDDVEHHDEVESSGEFFLELKVMNREDYTSGIGARVESTFRNNHYGLGRNLYATTHAFAMVEQPGRSADAYIPAIVCVFEQGYEDDHWSEAIMLDYYVNDLNIPGYILIPDNDILDRPVDEHRFTIEYVTGADGDGAIDTVCVGEEVSWWHYANWEFALRKQYNQIRGVSYE